MDLFLLIVLSNSSSYIINTHHLHHPSLCLVQLQTYKMTSTEVSTLVTEVLHLSQNCRSIKAATRNDKLFELFSQAPLASPNNKDKLIEEVDSTLNAAFGVDVGSKYLLTGPYGIELVLNYIQSVRKLPPSHWNRNCEGIVRVKLEGIRDKLLGQ